VEVREQLLSAIYAGQIFRLALRDLGLTSNQVWGLTKTDEEWSTALETALMASRQDDLKHGLQRGVYGRLCLQRVSGASAHSDGAAIYLVRVA
jgi:hypothetical protein